MWITLYKSEFLCVNIFPKLEIYTVAPLQFWHKLKYFLVLSNFNKTKISSIKFELQTFQDTLDCSVTLKMICYFFSKHYYQKLQNWKNQVPKLIFKI
jgi:hypothetical protein